MFRKTLQASVSIVALSLLVACGSAKASDDESTIRFGYYDTGGAAVSSYVPQVLAKQHEIQEKHEIKVEAVPYKNVQALYTYLNRKRVHVASSGIADAAGSANQGAPISMLCTVAPTSISIVSKDFEWSPESLRGKRITGFGQAAIDLLQAWILENWGMKEGEDYEFLPAQANSSAISQVVTGSADFAMAWQPHVADGLDKFPELNEVATPTDLVPGGARSWQFVLIGNTEKFDEATASRFRSAVKDTTDYIKENVDEVDKMATENKAPEGLLKKSVVENKVSLEVLPIEGKVRDEINADFEYLINLGRLNGLPEESLYKFE